MLASQKSIENYFETSKGKWGSRLSSILVGNFIFVNKSFEITPKLFIQLQIEAYYFHQNYLIKFS